MERWKILDKTTTSTAITTYVEPPPAKPGQPPPQRSAWLAVQTPETRC